MNYFTKNQTDFAGWTSAWYIFAGYALVIAVLFAVVFKEKKANYAPAKAVTAVKKDDTKPGFFKRVGKWFREMKSELKKVVWPTPHQVLKNTLIVLACVAVVGVFIWVFDFVARFGIDALIKAVH